MIPIEIYGTDGQFMSIVYLPEVPRVDETIYVEGIGTFPIVGVKWRAPEVGLSARPVALTVGPPEEGNSP